MDEKYNYNLENAVQMYESIQRLESMLGRRKKELEETLGCLSSEDLAEYARRTEKG